MVIARGDVWLAAQDPQRGRRIPMTRPCVVVSPPEMHDALREVIVAPLAASGFTQCDTAVMASQNTNQLSQKRTKSGKPVGFTFAGSTMGLRTGSLYGDEAICHALF